MSLVPLTPGTATIAITANVQSPPSANLPFTTISAPQLKTNVTPSQKPITWSFGGSINAAEADLK